MMVLWKKVIYARKCLMEDSLGSFIVLLERELQRIARLVTLSTSASKIRQR